MSLRLEGVEALYGKSRILNGVTLSVGLGETVSLIGRNGVGKSTTMKAVMGLVRPSAGRVLLRDRAIESEPIHRIARLGLGYVPEERRIFGGVSVLDNLLVARKAPTNRAIAPWTPERIYEHFPRLAERAKQRAGTLSGGEQQMLTIARTLMGNPEIVLVDEPMEGLAPMLVAQVGAMIDAIRASGAGILLVEQSSAMARARADRIYVMSKGAVVFEGTPAELDADPDVTRRHLQV